MADELERLVAPAAAIGPLSIEVAPGELIDKITILEIKSERIADPAKLANVRTELATLAAARRRSISDSAALSGLSQQLKAVNEALWDIEDAIRLCERDQDFGPRFVELARSVYRQNDRRAAIKRKINELLGSKLIEEKDYAPYENS
jgi:plasmid replication initiation protein